MQEYHSTLVKHTDRMAAQLLSVVERFEYESSTSSTDIISEHFILELKHCHTDLLYLACKLREVDQHIEGLKSLIKERMDYRHSFRNTMIAILVALYVPFSFATVSYLSPNRA